MENKPLFNGDACPYLSITKDPTANVQNMLHGVVARLDGFRELESKRIDELREAETRRVDQLTLLEASHTRELNDKEANRLDSIRQVDVLNQAAAAKSALDAIQALASTTTINADNIRNALNATAAQMAKQTTDLAAAIAVQSAATSDAITVRIAALEKASAEGIGKGRISDPQMESLLIEVKNLRDLQSTRQGSSGGMRDMWGWIFGSIVGLMSIIGLIYAVMKT